MGYLGLQIVCRTAKNIIRLNFIQNIITGMGGLAFDSRCISVLPFFIPVTAVLCFLFLICCLPPALPPFAVSRFKGSKRGGTAKPQRG